jgi:hypothetical protein
MTTLISIQDAYIATLMEAAARWSHRPGRIHQPAGGHFPRIARGARKTAQKRLAALGLSDAAARQALTDAYDVFMLELSAV